MTATPTAIGITDAVMIGVGGPGGNHGCALRQSGELQCWGRNGNSESGLDGPDPIATPMAVGNYPGATQLAIGSVFSCVLPPVSSVTDRKIVARRRCPSRFESAPRP